MLDGHVDPRSLTLVAHLRDGHTVRYTHSTTLLDATTGRRLVEPPVESYRPLTVQPDSFPPLEDPILDTVAQTQRAADPVNSDTWVLRSWRGRVDPRARFGSGMHPKSFYCWQAGVIEQGRLVVPVRAEPVPLAVSDALSSDGDTECASGEAPTAQSLVPRTRTYPENASAYAPRPARVVVTGVIMPPATDPQLIGAGAPRALSTDANHAYLLVLPGSYWKAPLQVQAHLPDGHTLTSPIEHGPPLLRPQVRAPDPDGSAPWGFTRTALCPTAWSIAEIGRVVEDRITAIYQRTGELAPRPGSTTGSPCASENAQLQRREMRGLLNFEVSHDEPEAGAALTQAQIDRRTLPGDTAIAGSAAADVESVTLSTPADVRTVRPVGPDHVFLVVYDGVFYRGAFTATARLTDGRTVTEQIPGASENPEDSRQPESRPLSAQLRSDEATLASIRRHVSQVEHASPGMRAKLLDGVPLAQLVRGLHGIRAIVAGERARIAYVREHPGLLPTE